MFKLFEIGANHFGEINFDKILPNPGKLESIGCGYQFAADGKFWLTNIEKSAYDDVAALFENMIIFTEQLFEQMGLTNTVRGDGLIWIQRYLDCNEHKVKIHYDDGTQCDPNWQTLNTAVFYINNTIEGGDLEIYEDGLEFKKIATLNTTNSPGKITVAVMDGRLWHGISKFRSLGIRESIVVQLRCIRK